MKKKYKSSGLVYGKYWGEGEGSYTAKTFQSNISEEDLINQNLEALKSGSLDSGMGYESLIGAILLIEIITTTEIEDEVFTNTKSSELFIGDLTHQQKHFLTNRLYNIDDAYEL